MNVRGHRYNGVLVIPDRSRHFGGSPPRPAPPPPPPTTENTTAAQEAAAKFRKEAQQRRGRKSTILTGSVNTETMLGTASSGKPTLGA